MNKWKKVLSVTMVLVMAMLLAACGGASGQAGAEPSEPETLGNGEKLTISQINWAENIAVTNMWKSILEDKGYEVELTVLDMGVTLQALESGALDVCLEIWLPVQDANYYEAFNETVNFSEATWFDNAKVGLVVPTYVEEVNSIEDLNEHKEMFNSEIIGIDHGAGTMDVTEELIQEYGLDFELIASSEPAMIASIASAINDGEAIVSPLWTPHWVFAEYDLKFLEDPKKMYGGVEKIHHATRLGFAEEFPEVSQWFNNWKMTDEEIAELITYVESAEQPIDGAEQWIDENQELIGEWVK